MILIHNAHFLALDKLLNNSPDNDFFGLLYNVPSIHEQLLLKGGEVIINTHEKVESASHKVFDVDATGIALEILGVNIVNTIILGYFAKKTGEVSIGSLLEVIKETFPGPIGEKNAVAAQKAYDMA